MLLFNYPSCILHILQNFIGLVTDKKKYAPLSYTQLFIPIITTGITYNLYVHVFMWHKYESPTSASLRTDDWLENSWQSNSNTSRSQNGINLFSNHTLKKTVKNW
jgi:hypothetical protein